MLPAVFTHCWQHPDMVDGAVSPINLIFHHLLHVASHLAAPIHPQQPIPKVGNIFLIVFPFFLLTFCGSTGLKHNKRHAPATTALSPSFKGCEVCRTQPGSYRQQGRPHKRETHTVHCSGAPTMLPLTNPPKPPHHRSPAHNNNSHSNPHPNSNDTTTSSITHPTSHTTDKKP
jgi:hypothetical protein